MKTIKVHDKTFVPYLRGEEIQESVKNLALRIHSDYKDEIPIFIGVLNGVIMFASDLLRYYPGDCELAFIQMSSYVGTQSTGVVYKKMELTKDIKDRHIILLEDIVDTGKTIEALVEYFHNTQRPKSVRLATVFFKPDVYKKDLKIDYIGREISDKFMVGYGLDYNELGRNFKDLYQLEEGKINGE